MRAVEGWRLLGLPVSLDLGRGLQVPRLLLQRTQSGLLSGLLLPWGGADVRDSGVLLVGVGAVVVAAVAAVVVVMVAAVVVVLGAVVAVTAVVLVRAGGGLGGAAGGAARAAGGPLLRGCGRGLGWRGRGEEVARARALGRVGEAARAPEGRRRLEGQVVAEGDGARHRGVAGDRAG